MKNKLPFFAIFFVFSIFSSSPTYADDFPTPNEVLGVVVEWSLEGNFIQVGNYLFTNLPKIYTDNGTKEIFRSNGANISPGTLVKVLLKVNEDVNASLIADKIIVLKEKGKQKALDLTSPENRANLLATIARFEDNNSKNNQNKSLQLYQAPTNSLYLENGVWKN